MRLPDYSPPSSPSLDQQRDALQKGLGRAMQWALAQRLDDEALLSACVKDLRHDTQLESSRGDWLWKMIQAMDAADRLRVPILHALCDLSDARSANQICSLAGEYARTGDDAFRTRLYQIVEQKPHGDSPSLGENEIIAIDGEPAFLYAAMAQGTWLASHEWDWDHDILMSHAIEQFGEQRVADLLDDAKGEAIGRFRTLWVRKKAAPEEDRSPTTGEEVRAIDVDRLLSAAAAADADTWRFQTWGRYAGKADLARVARHLQTVQEPGVLVNLINVFLRTPFPRFDPRLLELCRHPDPKVRRQAHYAIGNNSHRRIREFALAQLSDGVRQSTVLELFVRNYRRGDERRIVDALDLPHDDVELHWLLMSVIKVLENNPKADSSELALVVYGSTPCEKCRLDAVRLLHEQDAAPAWLLEECRFDANERCRSFVDDLGGPSTATK